MKFTDFLVASPGAITGKAIVMEKSADRKKMEPHAILVLKKSEPSFAECVMEASGLICETGGRLTHICVVAMEMGIPCVVQLERATEYIKDGDFISLNTHQNEINITKKD